MREDDVQGLSPDYLIDPTDPATDPTNQTRRAKSGPVATQPADLGASPSTPPSWLPQGATLNPDGSVRTSDGHVLPGPGTGFTRNPQTGIIERNANNPLTGPGAQNTPLASNSQWNKGGGWGESWASGDPYAMALSQAFDKGLTGQSAVDWTNQQPGANGIAYYADRNQYGLPNSASNPYGTYVSASGSGALDLQRRQQAEGGSAGGGAGSSGAGGSSLFSSLTAGSQDPAIHDAIMSLLGRGSTPLSADDPTLKAQFDPVSRQLQTGAQRTREAAAERLASSGNNSGGAGGALDAEVNGINEDLGAQQGAAMGRFTTSELAARRQDVVNAIGLAQGQQRIALQAQLQQIDAQLRQQALTQQNSQFYDTFSSHLADQNNNSDEELLRALGLG